MFDTGKEFEISIYSGGMKTCTVAWPSDADWKRRANKTRYKEEAVDRDKLKSSVIGAEPATLEMFEKIRKDDGDPFDAAEAMEVISRLEHCELCRGADGEPGIDVRGDRITVRMAALLHKGRARINGMSHVLKHPSMQQIRQYRMSSFDTYSVRKGTETIQPLGPGEALFNALVDKSEGYEGAVPVIHKDFVVVRLIAAIRELEEDGDSDE